MSLGERIKQIRKYLKLTQKQLAEQLDLKQNTIATYEMGRLTPSDRTISDICREFGVNEFWLRTGEGEMFAPKTTSDLLAESAGKLLGSNPDSTWTKIIVSLINLPEEDRHAAIRIALKIAETLREDVEKEGKE